MARSETYIRARLAIIEAHLLSADSLTASVGSDGTSLSRADMKALVEEQEELSEALARVTGASPMIVRGRVRNLR